MSLASILEYPTLSVRPAAPESGAVRLLRKVRPDWPKEEILLQRMTALEAASSDPGVRVFGGYVDDKRDMILVKVYSSDSVIKVKTM